MTPQELNIALAEWPEHWHEENGRYTHKCRCGAIFTGRNHEYSCRKCAMQDRREWFSEWDTHYHRDAVHEDVINRIIERFFPTKETHD